MSFLQIPIGTYPNTFLGYESSISMNASLGVQNTAFGYRTLRNNTTGDSNAAFGNDAMLSGITSKDNVAIGDGALRDATDPTNNTAVGSGAMLFTLSGSSNNVAIGTLAGSSAAANLRFNTFVGAYSGSFSSGQYNSFFGFRSGELITGSKNTIIGMFDGNQFGLDIRTLSNHIVLSDGDGNPRLWINNTGAVNIPGGLALTGSLSITGGTVTANNPVLSATQTWNNAAVTFTGWQLNVTDTASDAASLLMDLQVGGVSQFAVRKSSIVTATTFRVPENSGTIEMGGSLGSGTRFQTNGGNQIRVYHNGGSTISLNLSSFVADSNSSFSFTSGNIGTASDLFIHRDAANTLAQRNGVNAQTLRVYNTFTDASNYERGIFSWASNVLTIGTEAAGTGLARALEFYTNGVIRGSFSASASSFTVRNGSEGIALSWNAAIGFQLENTGVGGYNVMSIGEGRTDSLILNTRGSGIISFRTAAGTAVPSEKARIDAAGNFVINTGAIATNAVNGFLYVPGCAGTPTGVPTAYTGRVPIVVDTTNNKLYFYSGGAWRDAGP